MNHLLRHCLLFGCLLANAREETQGSLVWNASTFASKLLQACRIRKHAAKNAARNGMFRAALGGRELFSTSLQEYGPAIAFYTLHDASIALSKHGRVQCVLELERLFDERYYHFEATSKFRELLLKALTVVRDQCECDDEEFPLHFDDAVVVSGMHVPRVFALLPEIVEEMFQVRRWRNIDHHEAHALLGFHSSPFRSALVVSYDGGGNDGVFNAYVGFGSELRRFRQLSYNMGHLYNLLAALLPEVTGNFQSFQSCCEHLWKSTPSFSLSCDLPISLSNAGKLMGYAATGELLSHITTLVRGAFEQNLGSFLWLAPPAELLNIVCQSISSQRALAASIQSEFARFAHGLVKELLEHLGTVEVEGIVLTGGCALNVLTNQLIYDTLVSSTGDKAILQGRRFPLDIYVPPSPGDGGLTVGALWSVQPPRVRQPLQYLGFRLWDRDILDSEAYKRGAQRLSALGGVEYLAELLAGGLAWFRDGSNRTDKPIIGVVRGRQEFGPRALGHRSLLAVPDSDAIRVRMNRLKFRQWYRPVAPLIADEALEDVFGHVVKSPYMTMAPRVRGDILARFPALAHLDGTARHQSIGKTDEPWVHNLLLAVGKRIGLAALINTSLNTRGKPISNTVRASLQMLEELPDLDFVLIEDWLFRAPSHHNTSVLGI